MGVSMWLVIPCFNEQEILDYTIECLDNKMQKLVDSGIISDESKMVFIDDGSTDETWGIITEASQRYKRIVGLKLAHNKGHQNALLAGMMYVKDKCDCMISMDADLQDDIDVLEQFVMKYNEGAQIVYGIRNDRRTDSKFKRVTANLFYKLMKVLGAETINNHADYRLMGRQALEALEEYEETTLFLRGIVPIIGMKTDRVFYERKERKAGKTKYPFVKMAGFALDGITSFSVKPLRLIALLGVLFSGISILGLIYALASYFFGYTVPGWTAIVFSIWLLGGIQLLCIGVVGEYIGKIFSEVKRRPRYYIEKEVKFECKK
ncbi:MAG: glycosyltransferase family 2 protein [Lachnospiraceae bacterium]|nr:glycosyltransferase family 2 protein [Lachnospiraceae bacterium]